MDHIEPPGDPPAGTAGARASHRLRLEVDLLATPDPDTDSGPVPTRSGRPLRTVLLALGDADLYDYVRGCLRARPDLLPEEPAPGEGTAAAARRLHAALVIVEPRTLDELPPDLAPPVLLLVQEAGEHGEAMPAAASRLAILPQPFNARQLLAGVAALLGPGENVQPP